MGWRGVRRWVVAGLVLVALAGFTVLQSLGAKVWAAVAAGGLAVLGVVVPLVVERLKRAPGEVEAVRAARLPSVGEVVGRARQGADRWGRLGVHAAIALPEGADPALPAALPRYVERDADRRVRAWLADAAAGGGLLLLVGGSSVGKTRLALEAIAAGAVKDWRMLRPLSGGEVGRLVPASGGTVVWLDEIQNFLTGPDALTFADVDRVLGSGRVILVGTVWLLTFEQLSAVPPPQPGNDVLKDARLILQRAYRVDIPDTFSAAELAQAAASDDPRLREAALAGPRVTETLAAVPDLVRRWRHGGDEFGVLVVTAATLCRRAGHPDVLPPGLLEGVTTALLSDRQRPRAGGDWFTAALVWAQEPVRGASALLWPVGAAPGVTDGHAVADAIVQDAGRDAAPPNRPLDRGVWTVVAAHADLDGCRAMLDTLHLRADAADEGPVRELLWRRGAELGDAAAMVHLGGLLIGFGLATAEPISSEAQQESRAWYRRGAELGHPTAMFLHAGALLDAGRPEEALDWYARVADQPDADARGMAQYNRAGLLYELDRLDEAEAAYRTAVDSGVWAAVYPFGALLADAGRTDEAEQLYRRAADAGQPGAMAGLGELAAEAGRTEEAERWWRQAADGGDPSAMNALAVLLAQAGRPAEAETWAARAIDGGVPLAAVNVALQYAADGEEERAETWFRRAHATDPELLVSVGYELAEAGRAEEAEILYRRGAELGDARGMTMLGVTLDERGDAGGAETWYRRAAAESEPVAMYALGALLAGTDRDAEGWDWIRRSAEAGYGEAAETLAAAEPPAAE